MASFDEVQFPPSISFGATGGPGFSTKVVILSSGYEARNQNWSLAREGTRCGLRLTFYECFSVASTLY